MFSALQSVFGFSTPEKENKKSSLSALDNSKFDPAHCRVYPLPEQFCLQGGRTPKYAAVIENVLTAEECAAWIADTEAIGYEQALVNIGNGQQLLMLDYRKSSRCIVDDEERAAALWERIKGFIPSDLIYYDEYIPRELNERLRCLRYDPGDYFAPHRDGAYEHPTGHPKAGDRSFVTFQLYLNEGFAGGSTRVFADRKEQEFMDVVPKTGSVFLFDHGIYHSGELLESGRKYAVRTDVMFTRKPDAAPKEDVWADVPQAQEDAKEPSVNNST